GVGGAGGDDRGRLRGARRHDRRRADGRAVPPRESTARRTTEQAVPPRKSTARRTTEQAVPPRKSTARRTTEQAVPPRESTARRTTEQAVPPRESTARRTNEQAVPPRESTASSLSILGGPFGGTPSACRALAAGFAFLDLRLPARDHLLVDLRLGRAGGDELLGLLHLLVDQLLEVVDGLGARQEPTGDEERRGAAGAEGHALVLLRGALLVERGVGQVLLELLDVESQIARPRHEVLVGELLLVLEQLVVHLPELALLARSLGRE